MTAEAVSKPSKEKRIPGEEGVWVFVLGDMTVFALFFATFIYYRAEDVQGFQQAQALLSQNYGAMNTILLLTSSWFVVLGLNAIRRNMTALATKLYGAAFACGLGFGIVKIFEWGDKIQAGHTLTSHDFFMYYFIFTGVHMLHVLIGLGVLAYLIAVCKRGVQSDSDHVALESGSVYWHMVDLLWIVLFPLLYMLR